MKAKEVSDAEVEAIHIIAVKVEREVTVALVALMRIATLAMNLVESTVAVEDRV